MSSAEAPSAQQLQELNLQIEGMDCPDELEVIDRRLQRLPGVGALRPNYVNRSLRVQYDPAQTDAQRIATAIREVGFAVHGEGIAPSSALGGARYRRPLLLALAWGVLAVAGGVHLWAEPPSVLVDFWLVLALLAVSTVLSGYHVARSGLRALMRGVVDMYFLMTVAATGGFILAWRYGELPFEAATVMGLFSAALWLENLSLDRARQAIHALMELAPAQATRLQEDGRPEAISTEEIQVGDRLLVRPGDKVPTDGVVLDGQSTVNESPVTGESLPIDKGPEDAVFAGSLNGEGAFVIRATRTADQSTLAKMIHLVEQAQATRAPTQQFVDRFARFYTPAVIVLALLVAVWPPLSADLGLDVMLRFGWWSTSWDFWIYRGLVLLVIACPCALVISTPVTIICGLTRAARFGVLIKGGVHLENSGRLRAVVFDKTGTLTTGQVEVSRVVPAEGYTAEEVLRLAAAIEQHSEHPLAHAVVREARRRGVEVPPIRSFEALRGLGARADWDGRTLYAGSSRLFEQLGLASRELEAAMRSIQQEAGTPIMVGTETRLVGVIVLADRIRPQAQPAIGRLRELGVRRLAMLTGDSGRVAEQVAHSLGLEEFYAQLLPQEKVERVRELRRRYQYVAMVGDGVNDAPALASATLGVAMGTAGSDTALETADVALMSDDLLRLPDLIALGRKTRRIIAQNITMSLAIKAVFLLLVLAGPAVKLMWLAVAADMGASLLVIFNGMRLAVGRWSVTA